MNLVRYSVICILCATVVVISGCTKSRVSVVNTNSGIVIHADDYLKQSETQIQKIQPETPKHTGNVIHLGNGYEKIDLPSFDRL